ncbi:MAG TPA: shikimate dehydrogenase [Verrucomicrobiae bacterium]|nr:shikimate dehydrogenase [Verrucomicrobiae bacterium]
MSEPVPSVINASTRLCAVYGFPIRHSASPAMHNAAFAALDLNWRYLAFEVHPQNLRAAIAGARAMQFSGLNLTVPHKLLALEMVEELDVSAKIWGAVNTIRFEGRTANGGWHPLHHFDREPPAEIRAQGFNTDADAMIAALREDLKLDLRGKKVLLLGLGGAGWTAASRLASEGVSELFLVNRTYSKILEVQREIEQKFPSVSVGSGYPQTDIDLLINATSLGLRQDDSLPVDEKQFPLHRAGAVYDMIYKPAETKLLALARAAGCRTSNGLGMLLHQGAAAFEIWTGKPAPVEVMRRALELNVYGTAK